MTDRTRNLSVLLAAVLVASTVAGVGGVAATTNATSESTLGHDNGVGANYTVELPDQSDHYPGDENGANASIWHLATAQDTFEQTSSPEGIETLDWIVIRNQDVDFSECTTQDTRAFGVDRGNDQSGTTYDEDLLAHRKDSSFNDHSITVHFFGEDSLAGSPTYLNDTDQVVAVQVDCYEMPNEPGWYQINARINGTGWSGEYVDSANVGTIRSHYFYVCMCSSRQEAEQKLGPPPGSEDPGSGGSTPTATATPTPTADGSDDATATPTPTPTADDSEQSDQSTPTPTDEPDRNSPTASPTSGGGNDGGNDDGGGGNAQTTPTVGSGPGLGAALALIGLLGAALLAVRRAD